MAFLRSLGCFLFLIDSKPLFLVLFQTVPGLSLLQSHCEHKASINLNFFYFFFATAVQQQATLVIQRTHNITSTQLPKRFKKKLLPKSFDSSPW